MADKPKRAKAFLFIGIATLFIIAGCSSGNGNETVGTSAEANRNDIETLYKEADEVVLEYTKAQYEYNLPVLFDLAPPKVQEEYLNEDKVFLYFLVTAADGGVESNVPVEDLFNPEKFKEVKAEYDNADYNENHETFFQDFSSAEEKLYIVRFNHLFETEGELAYFVRPWMRDSNDPNAGGKRRIESSGHIKVKQNNNGEWKVIETTSGQFRKEGINTANRDEIRAKGTVVHEREREDPYGF